MVYLLHRAVDESAHRHPDRPAFRFLDQTLTYARLVARSNQLARALADQGVRRGDRVGLYLNKSLESAVALYGIMRAGAAYVPLDPGAPPSRLGKTLRHCGIRHLVTHTPKARALTALLEEPTPVECVIGIAAGGAPGLRTLDWSDVATAPADQTPETGVMEQDIAYIMYTSGSTGAPKGIVHTHASGLGYARMSADTYGLGHEDILSNHSPLHFDMSTLEYFSGPLRGAATLIIPEAYTKLPASLSKLIQDERATIWYSVPFALIQLLLRGMIEERDLSALRWVLFGGEPFPTKHLRALRRRLPQTRFSNVYGPAEVNQCTFYNLSDADPPGDEPIPIGRVWSNAEGLVVDETDRPVPQGESGELLVRTPTMMRGYWGEPELNQRAFFRRPVTGGVEDLFYRTGDLVQARADGELMFLGRKDRQVKTRGYRVELDEIESVLSAHDDVEEAAAYAIPGADDPHLEAAVVPRADAKLDEDALRTHCASQLPPYAVPTRFRMLRSFPRTTSGKIDRKALQAQAMSSESEMSE